VNGNEGEGENRKSVGKPEGLFLDMGLGSREQGFCKQATESKPKLKLVHSSDRAPA
jgi:hypothetical protein